MGKLDATQDCSGGNCFSTVAVAGFRSDGSPKRFDVQIRDAARFVGSADNEKTVGQFPTGNEIDVPPGAIVTDNTINIPPGAIVTSGGSGPGSVPSSGHWTAAGLGRLGDLPSVQITSIKYVGLVGNTHRLKILYKITSNLSCFNRRAEFSGSSASISLFVRDRQLNKSRVIDNSNSRAQLKLSQDCSSTGDCLSVVSVTGKATDDPPAAMSASVFITVSVNGRGFGEKNGSF
jgi:hypothetical protein